MSGAYDDALPLEEQVAIALDELVRASGLSVEQIVELVEYGAFEPVTQAAAPGDVKSWRFAARYITIGRSANRLRREFDLSASGLALALALLERIEELEHHVRTLEAQLLRG
jgi:chaperone modulatory protein CbpM